MFSSAYSILSIDKIETLLKQALPFCIITLMLCTMRRSSYRRYSVEKGVLKNLAKFTGKYLCQENT